MTELATTLLFLLATMLALPVVMAATECLLAVLPRQRHAVTTDSHLPAVTVLVPAHDEEHSITPTLRSVLAQFHPADRLVVIADHCTDSTAEVAAAAGAEVINHGGKLPRGKGHALNAGLDALRDNPPDIVVILDADCILAQGSLAVLAGVAQHSGRPVQACYVMETPGRQDIPGQVSAFAFLVRNVVRPLGLTRAGLPCHLMGTGMAFPWQVIQATPVPTDHLVEDLQMGIDLLKKGQPPMFCFAAQVTSQLPPTRQGAQTQRKRWEHGHLRTMFREAPRLVLEALTRKRFDLIMPALDLAVPPLSLLVLTLIAGLLLTAGIALAGGPALPFMMLACAAVYFLVAIFAAWARFGRQTIPLSSLLKAPLYVISKLPVYLGFVTRPERSWHGRSERETDK